MASARLQGPGKPLIKVAEVWEVDTHRWSERALRSGAPLSKCSSTIRVWGFGGPTVESEREKIQGEGLMAGLFG